MTRTVIAALVGGILMFGWGALSHMLLPLWDEALHPVPAEHEARVANVLRGTLGKEGVFVLPGFPPREGATPEEEGRYEAAVAAGPTAWIAFHPGAGTGFGPRPLALELASNVLACFLVALVLATMQTGFFGRLVATLLIGAAGWVSLGASDWIWHSFPPVFLRAELLDQLGGWFCAGVGLALVVRGTDEPLR